MKWNKKVSLAEPWFDEREVDAAAEVIRSGWVIAGPKVRAFEEAFAAMHEVKHAIAVNSGSSALLVSMAAVGLEPGDEILAPDMTFVSTASACLFLGATPRFVDITFDDYCMDPARLEESITNQTKVIVPVHYAGHTAKMNAICGIARRAGIAVLEDAAEAHLSKFDGSFAGTLGDIGIFSFTPSKPMTTGEGGMIVTNDDTLAERCRSFRNFGDSSRFEWDRLGFNFRMPEALGAMGLVQLGKLPEAVERRRKIAGDYDEALSGREDLVVPPRRSWGDTNYQLYTVRLTDTEPGIRDDVIREMAQRGVQTRLYYPPLHRAGVFRDHQSGEDGQFPKTLEFAATALSLPIYPTMSPLDHQYVVEALQDSLETVYRQ